MQRIHFDRARGSTPELEADAEAVIFHQVQHQRGPADGPRKKTPFSSAEYPCLHALELKQCDGIGDKLP